MSSFLEALINYDQPKQNPQGFDLLFAGLNQLATPYNGNAQEHLNALAGVSPIYAQQNAQLLGQLADPNFNLKTQAYLSQINIENQLKAAQLNKINNPFSDPLVALGALNTQSQIKERDSQAALQQDKLLRQQRAQAILGGQAPSSYSAQSAGSFPMMVPPNPTGGALAQLASAVRQVESGGNPNAVSPKGAQGLMQVMPQTGANPGFGVTPLQNNSPEENVRFGTDYLAALTEKYGGDTVKALAAYNAGPGTVDKALQSNPQNWLSQLPAETQNYIPKVLGSLPPQPQLPAPLGNPPLASALANIPLPANLNTSGMPLPEAPVGQQLPAAPVQTPLQAAPVQGMLPAAPVNSQALPQTMPFVADSNYPQYNYVKSPEVALLEQKAEIYPEGFRELANQARKADEDRQKADYDRRVDQYKLQQAPALEAAKAIAGEQAKADVGKGQQDKARAKFDETLQKIADNLQELDKRKAIASASEGEMGRLYVDQQPGFLSPFTPDLARKGTFGKELAKTQSIYDDNENLRQLALQQYKAATGTKSGEVNSISELQQVLKGLGDSKFSVEAQLKALQNASEAFGSGSVKGSGGNTAGGWSIKVK